MNARTGWAFNKKKTAEAVFSVYKLSLQVCRNNQADNTHQFYEDVHTWS